jgi:protoporphyrinogen oxidase
MRVGIIGGGLMGIALAYFLAETGEQVTILEQGTELGGLNGELQFEDGLSVARYQHAIMPTDQSLYDLLQQLNLGGELIFQNVQTGFVHDNQIHAMANVRDFLTFPILSLRDRIRLGNIIIRSRSKRNWHELDIIPAKKWLVEVGGNEAFEQIWRPLLEAKFDGIYDDVAATYIWAWLNRMSAIRRGPRLQGSVGYLRRGHYSLIKALADQFVARGGRIESQARVREIDITGGQLQRVRTNTGSVEYDVLVAAIATPNFARLIPGADQAYLSRLDKSKYLGLICPVLILDRPLSSYWTLNLTDSSIPFSTIIETPHPEAPNYHVVYLPRYTAPDNDWMGVSDDDIRAAWLSHLKPIFPNFDESQIRHFAVSRSRYVEPVYHVRTLENMPAVETPYPGLYLANTAQVYPELATSEAAIAHARHVAKVVKQRRAAASNVVN